MCSFSSTATIVTKMRTKMARTKKMLALGQTQGIIAHSTKTILIMNSKGWNVKGKKKKDRKEKGRKEKDKKEKGRKEKGKSVRGSSVKKKSKRDYNVKD